MPGVFNLAEAIPEPQPRTVRLKDAISLARAKYGYDAERTPREYNARKARDQAKYWKKKYADPEFRAKKLADDKARRQRIREDPVLFEQYRQHKNEIRRRWVADLKENHPERYAEFRRRDRVRCEQYRRQRSVEDPGWHEKRSGYARDRYNRIKAAPEQYDQYLAQKRENVRAYYYRMKEEEPERWREVQAARRRYYTEMRENRPEEYAVYLAKRREQYRARKEASNAR